MGFARLVSPALAMLVFGIGVLTGCMPFGVADLRQVQLERVEAPDGRRLVELDGLRTVAGQDEARTIEMSTLGPVDELSAYMDCPEMGPMGGALFDGEVLELGGRKSERFQDVSLTATIVRCGGPWASIGEDRIDLDSGAPGELVLEDGTGRVVVASDAVHRRVGVGLVGLDALGELVDGTLVEVTVDGARVEDVLRVDLGSIDGGWWPVGQFRNQGEGGVLEDGQLFVELTDVGDRDLGDAELLLQAELQVGVDACEGQARCSVRITIAELVNVSR